MSPISDLVTLPLYPLGYIPRLSHACLWQLTPSTSADELPARVDQTEELSELGVLPRLLFPGRQVWERKPPRTLAIRIRAAPPKLGANTSVPQASDQNHGLPAGRTGWSRKTGKVVHKALTDHRIGVPDLGAIQGADFGTKLHEFRAIDKPEIIAPTKPVSNRVNVAFIRSGPNSIRAALVATVITPGNKASRAG